MGPKTSTARFGLSRNGLYVDSEKSGREDLNLRPPGPESGESGLLKREETRGFLMLSIEPFARFPVQPVEVC